MLFLLRESKAKERMLLFSFNSVAVPFNLWNVFETFNGL